MARRGVETTRENLQAGLNTATESVQRMTDQFTQALGFAGPAYAVAAALLGAGFLWHAWRVWREPQDALGRSSVGDAAAKRTFRYSLLYLALLFAALPLDRLVSP